MKTFVRSPIDGIVLRKHHQLGESVTNASISPDRIVTIGNERVLRVRVDVDENDVARFHLGDRGYVTADAVDPQWVSSRYISAWARTP